MIAGHFGLAAAVKAREPSTPLWALMLATQWLDVVFAPLFAAGLEGMEPIAGAAPGAYGGAVIHADYTHSLVGALILSAVLGALLSLRYGKRSGVVIGAVALSHWFLDVCFHRHDMPLLPGDASPLRLGFGLWQQPVIAAVIELIFVLVGSAMYWRAATGLAPNDVATTQLARRCALGVFVACLGTLGLNLVGM